MSSGLSACAPPLMMFISGVRQHAGVDAAQIAVERQAGSAAAALAAARLTARMALAPSRALFSVPSSSIIAASSAGLVDGVEAGDRVGDLAVDGVDRLGTPLPR